MLSKMRHFPLIACAAVFGTFIFASLTMSALDPGGRPFGMEWVSLFLLIAVAVMVPLIAFEVIDNKLHRTRAVRALSSRPQLSAEEFGKKFFGENEGCAAIAADVRSELERFTRLPLGG